MTYFYTIQKQNFWRGMTYFLLALLLQSCQTEPLFDTSTEEFILKKGYEIEVIAAEPLLDSPVAINFDAKGRIWVIELPGYMRDIEGSEEDKPDGKIVVLSDENGDGLMDKRQVFMDSMVAPRTLLHAYGGLLYSDKTSLWWAELEDTKIVRKLLVDSLYVVGGNIEHQPNGLLYNLDNWIYSANSKVRYRLKNGEWLREPTSFRGQWGISADMNGRLYYNNNSLPIATDYTMPNQLLQNPYQQIKFNNSQDIATSRKLFAYQVTSVNRGYQKGVLDREGKIKEFTSACSPLIYTGNLLEGSFIGNAFVCAPEANLIKRYILKEKNGLQTADLAYEESEFLVSKEETFRPVNLYNAPDGSMAILDLRKGIIQHRAYMTSYLREKILGKGLDSINGMGRIYRIVATKNKNVKNRNFNGMSKNELVELLTSSLLYERNFAQQELVARQVIASKTAIEQIALNAQKPYGQLHAMWTLEGLDAFEESLWSKLTAISTDPIVHETLVRFSAFFPTSETMQLSYFQKISKLNHPYINQQLVIRLGKMKSVEARGLLLDLAENNRNNAVLCEAIISGIGGKESDFLATLKPLSEPDSLSSLLQKVLENKRLNKVQTPSLPTKTYKDNRTAGFALYSLYCASCHGLDGIGKENLAPPLMNSEYVGGSIDPLIALVLNGMQGPVTVNGKRYEMNAAMPGVKNNSSLSDKDIADLLVFLRNSFSLSDSHVPVEGVTKWREKLEGRDELFTEEELGRLTNDG